MSLLAYPTLLAKLKSARYRRAFLSASVRNKIALQIRALRISKFKTQEALGEAAGKPANVISRLENPNYGKVRLQTLVELAEAFDVALVVRFATYSELASDIEDTSDPALDVMSFADELAAIEGLQASRSAAGPQAMNQALSDFYANAVEANRDSGGIPDEGRILPQSKLIQLQKTPSHEIGRNQSGQSDLAVSAYGLESAWKGFGEERNSRDRQAL